jgi:hypothetical protein
MEWYLGEDFSSSWHVPPHAASPNHAAALLCPLLGVCSALGLETCDARDVSVRALVKRIRGRFAAVTVTDMLIV